MNSHSIPTLSAVVAMSDNRVIGRDNQLPWHLPADLQHFKAITTGHPILMGRKTYESIGKPLPNRTNLILTRDQAFIVPGAIVIGSLEAALEECNKLAAPELFVIGGAQIYAQLLPRINRIYLTLVHATIQGDTYFPALSSDDWEELSREHHEPDAKNAYAYSFILFQRRLAINN